MQPWKARNQYSADDEVVHGRHLYRALRDVRAMQHAPDKNPDWELVQANHNFTIIVNGRAVRYIPQE